MPVFRSDLAKTDDRPITAEVIRELSAAMTHPANFFVQEQVRLCVKYVPDEILFWELFHGQVLDRDRTRRRQHFEAWNVYVIEPNGTPAAEPMLSIKHDATAGRLFVTRAIYCRAHESYDSGGNVIQTREVHKWQRELVGTIVLAELTDAGALRDELACALFHAVVGVSRLPLTSVEAPLPAFTLGQLGYFHRPAAVTAGEAALHDPLALCSSAIMAHLARAEYVKLWELIIRASSMAQVPTVALNLARTTGDDRQGEKAVRALFLDLFNAVSLSPYTDFVRKALAVLRHWAELEPTPRAKVRAEVIAHLLLLIARHLSAYDLVTFHHRGANYPDALLIDELLAELLPLTAQAPELFANNSLLRRAVRHGLLVVEEYAGHPVPDIPTSPGENLRVLPEPYTPVPDDQIFLPITRQRQLFPDGMAQVNCVALDCFRDLNKDHELVELGTALYLDRPLGFAKAPGEPDQTLLTSYVLFSRTIADARLQRLARRPDLLADPDAVMRWREWLASIHVEGLALTNQGAPPRPGVVSLNDALRLADDWVILRTTQKTLNDFVAQYDLRPLENAFGETLPGPHEWRLLVSGGTEEKPTFCVYDRQLRLRLELCADLSRGYSTRGGVEFPLAGLRLLRAWTGNGTNVVEPLELGSQDIHLPALR